MPSHTHPHSRRRSTTTSPIGEGEATPGSQRGSDVPPGRAPHPTPSRAAVAASKLPAPPSPSDAMAVTTW
uniref:Uncharacterized protein n=1 Tax=Oryza meridionalis TaxID=40149 RepID=A0A0E0CP64_9ORYZ